MFKVCISNSSVLFSFFLTGKINFGMDWVVKRNGRCKGTIAGKWKHI